MLVGLWAKVGIDKELESCEGRLKRHVDVVAVYRPRTDSKPIDMRRCSTE